MTGKKKWDNTFCWWDWWSRLSHSLVVRIQTSTNCLEGNLAISNKITDWPRNVTLESYPKFQQGYSLHNCNKKKPLKTIERTTHRKVIALTVEDHAKVKSMKMSMNMEWLSGYIVKWKSKVHKRIWSMLFLWNRLGE